MQAVLRKRKPLQMQGVFESGNLLKGGEYFQGGNVLEDRDFIKGGKFFESNIGSWRLEPCEKDPKAWGSLYSHIRHFGATAT